MCRDDRLCDLTGMKITTVINLFLEELLHYIVILGHEFQNPILHSYLPSSRFNGWIDF